MTRSPTALAGALALLRPFPAAAAALAGLIVTTPATADQVIADDAIIQGNLCAGSDCINGQAFPAGPLLLSQPDNRIRVEDTSGADYPADDWQLIFNSSNTLAAGGINKFTVRNRSEGNNIFTLEGAAPDNALYVDDEGKVGLGTSLPLSEFHIASDQSPFVRLEQTTATGSAPYTWKIGGDAEAFLVRGGDYLGVQSPATRLLIETSSNSIIWLEDGFGVNTSSPKANLHGRSFLPSDLPGLLIEGIGSFTDDPIGAFAHIRDDDGDTMLLIEELSTTTNPRTLLNLQNNGRPEIVMANTATGGEWSFGAGTKFILKQGAVGSASSAKTKLFDIDDSGNATLAGSLTTGGTTCGGGCDRVFTETAILPQPAYARQMWAQGFLPHVGPTPEGAPLNVSQKLGGMLNALEHAHVFIDRQGAEIDRQNQRISELEQLVLQLIDQQKGPFQ